MILDTLQTVGAFIFTLGILVTIHEYGHFWMARRCGVKVLRFSVGFGKPLWSRKDRYGTEFSIAAILLGGYVKMLDEREGPVAESEKHLSFNSQPVLSRMAIVAAGPVANFLLAIVVLWLMYFTGVKSIVPQVGEVRSDSPAFEAGINVGDEIVSVDGRETLSWQAVNMELLSFIGDTKALSVSVRSGRPGEVSNSLVVERQLMLNNWLTDEEDLDPLAALGIIPYRPKIEAVLGAVVPGEAAEQAGMISGDQIISADGMGVQDWSQWVNLVREHPESTIDVVVLRSGEMLSLRLTPRIKVVEGNRVGYIGAGVREVGWPEGMVRSLQYGPVDALFKGVEATWALTTMTFGSLWKMVVGLLSVKNLSGPITIAKVASASMQSGFESFLYFLGMISVSLGVLNLLPIPVLDGGHLLFCLVELFRGKPLSEGAQMLSLKIGVALVMCVMTIAIFNDLSRLF